MPRLESPIPIPTFRKTFPATAQPWHSLFNFHSSAAASTVRISPTGYVVANTRGSDLGYASRFETGIGRRFMPSAYEVHM